MRIAIVAGEVSGDILGASLMKSLLEKDSTIDFIGVGGPRMIECGFYSLFPMDRLSVMGFVEPLKRLPELLNIRKTVKQYCVENAVDVFIGIDSPDFNIPIERFLKGFGIKTVHYVSPSVWAWRQSRIKKIKKSVDLMLTLLPFESDFYVKHNVPVKFVGHPLADDIPMQPNTAAARDYLGVESDKPIIALMPGSRSGEVKLLGELFLQVAAEVDKQLGGCRFLLPAANEERKKQIELLLTSFKGNIDIKLIDGQSHRVMEASNAVLLASGTTALEAMLLKKPMLVSYKMAPVSAAIVSRLLNSKYVSLPNLLADEMLVPELLQDDATLENLTNSLLSIIGDQSVREKPISRFYQLHESIQCDASNIAATAVMELIDAQ